MYASMRMSTCLACRCIECDISLFRMRLLSHAYRSGCSAIDFPISLIVFVNGPSPLQSLAFRSL